MRDKHLEAHCALLVVSTWRKSGNRWEIMDIAKSFGVQKWPEINDEDLEPFYLCLSWYDLWLNDGIRIKIVDNFNL